MASENALLALVVDLDGSIINTDTLHESIFLLIKKNLLFLFLMPFWLLKGISNFKHEIAERVSISAERLPYNKPLLEYILGQKREGRKIVLATAANKKIAQAVADHLGIFDIVLSSDKANNLKGGKKLEAIEKAVGKHFIYIGDSRADLPIWNACGNAILAGNSSTLNKKIDADVNLHGVFYNDSPDLKAFIKAFRVHQWSKNLLIFVPLLTSFTFFDFQKLFDSLLAFVAFSLAASATYIFNDLWDLDNDRLHPRKRTRPFASGVLSVGQGVLLAIILLFFSGVIGVEVGTSFLGMLVLYIALTTFYSLRLKKYILIDVLMLSMLYTHRILSGAVVIHEPMTSWLLAFSVFLFFSLALVKRCSELVSLREFGKESSRGRDYRVSDLDVLWPLGVGAGLCSVVVFGLFISSAETQLRYATPQILWLTGVGLIYWISRLWMKTARGEMHDDPLIFAARDFGSLFTVGSMILCVLSAYFIRM